MFFVYKKGEVFQIINQFCIIIVKSYKLKKIPLEQDSNDLYMYPV